MRVLPVVCGLALLVVVFLVGTRVGDLRVGALAAVLLLLLRVYTGGDSTGILLLDRARINRYDIAVPVFGLLALWTFLKTDRHRARARAFLTGVLTGLASLTHLFGVFWLPVFLALSVCRRADGVGPLPRAGLVLGGFLFAWFPWAVYVASGWQDFLGQMRFVSPRFDLFNVSFYIDNAWHGAGPLSIDWMRDTIRTLPIDRPGAWSVILGLPIAGAVLVWTVFADRGRHQSARTLGVVVLVQFVMFLTLLKVKTINYMIGLWPLAVLLLAWLGIWLWDRRQLAIRGVVVAVVAVIVVEGGTRVAHASAAARRALPYDFYTTDIARCMPEGSLVLGLQHYWFGLRQYRYRTWLLPILTADPLYHHAPLPLDQALETIDPDVILIDHFMTTFFAAASRPDHPLHSMQTAFEAFMARRRAEPVCAVHNRTYGTMSVYRVPK